MVMSIFHRITGAANYFGMALLAGWLMAAASGPNAFAAAQDIFGSLLGLLVLFGFSWSVIHHWLGGIRHLIWDSGVGFSKRARDGLAWATIIGSLTLTALFWAVVLLLR